MFKRSATSGQPILSVVGGTNFAERIDGNRDFIDALLVAGSVRREMKLPGWPVTSVAIARDSSLVLYVGSSITLLHVHSGRVASALLGLEDGDRATSCTLGPDAAPLAAATAGRMLRIFDIDATPDSLRPFAEAAHVHPLVDCALAPRRSRAAACDAQGAALVWELGAAGVEPQLLATLMPQGAQLSSHCCFLSASLLATSGTGRGGVVHLWDVSDAARAATPLVQVEATATEDGGAASDVGLTASALLCCDYKTSPRLLVCLGLSAQIWDPGRTSSSGSTSGGGANPRRLGMLSGHASSIRACRFSSSGSAAVTLSGRDTLRVYDSYTSALMRCVEGAGTQFLVGVGLSPDDEQQSGGGGEGGGGGGGGEGDGGDRLAGVWLVALGLTRLNVAECIVHRLPSGGSVLEGAQQIAI